MHFNKQPISVIEQIELLQNRGLIIIDKSNAFSFLSNVSYYRFRAYTFPFQNNSLPNHNFLNNITFEEIVDLYIFDSRLRSLLFEAIEKIEIALRTQLIYNYAIKYGSHWHLEPNFFNNLDYYKEHIITLNKEVQRSNEIFIKHYSKKYTTPIEPPCWMSLEVSSLGLLSKIFANLKKDNCKKDITNYFGLIDADILKNWIFCFSILRNTCAHHGRVWNRRFPEIILPRKTKNTFFKIIIYIQIKFFHI